MTLSKEATAKLGGTVSGAKRLWEVFWELSQIPRRSGHEELITGFVHEAAKRHGLEWRRDAKGNTVVVRPGSGGGENAPTVIVQSHVDMVTEKNDSTEHDFSQDPILFKQEGAWLKAQGTTLGADNGIGAAAALVLMEQPGTACLPPLELLFTVDEETGLNGAKVLDNTALGITGKRLVNMDSEEWGEVCIGCAGGGDSRLRRTCQLESCPEGYAALRVAVKGLQGGHSGVQIHEDRGNAVKMAVELSTAVLACCPSARVQSFQGGNKHNAIAREARVELLVPAAAAAEASAALEHCKQGLVEAYQRFETGLTVEFETSQEVAGGCLSAADSSSLLELLSLLPHGPEKYSHAMKGLVETSNNVASCSPTVDGSSVTFEVVCASRSSIQSRLEGMRARIAMLARRLGWDVSQNEAYPGWNPNPDSPMVSMVIDVYKDKFQLNPKLVALHAGLECGILNEKLGGGLEMVSYGPTITGPHSPDEKVFIPSVVQFWLLTEELMKRLAQSKGA